MSYTRNKVVLRWSDMFRPLAGEFKVDSATTLNYGPQ